METNIGKLDQTLRVIGMILSLTFFVTHRDGGFVSNAAGFLGIYLFMTALTKYSPLWDILGISTLKQA